MVRDFQAIIGREAASKCAAEKRFGLRIFIACVGGGLERYRAFLRFPRDCRCKNVGIEAGVAG